MQDEWKLFLDDKRIPLESDWIIVRSVAEAQSLITAFGMPTYISFDHDLGVGPSGFDFAKWLCDQHLNDEHHFPHNFDFYVHSMNPVGRENIDQYLRNFLKFIKG